MSTDWTQEVRWDAQGLLPVIAQEASTKDVLMFAWMNQEALEKTLQTGQAVYFSRSRNRLWFKGEESGHVQRVHEMRLDCDQDVLLLTVTQEGHTPSIACHTGRHSCFYLKMNAALGPKDPAQEPVQPQWEEVEPVLKSPGAIYAKSPGSH
jgi:phosphoribosyl-AMP cyclohydrolase